MSTTFSKIPLDSALLVLSAASNVNISWNPADLPTDKKVSLVASYLKLGLALDNVFVGTDLKYRIIGNQLVIVRRTAVEPPTDVATIHGRISDEQGELLVGAVIFSDDYVYNAVANEYGFYSLSAPTGQKYTLNCSYLGFERRAINFVLSRDTSVDITLRSNNVLNEVVIVSDPLAYQPTIHDNNAMPIHLLNGMVALAGEPDVIRMMQMQAGVSPQADGFGGLQVRGGSVDQNLILLDGVPLYNTGHAFGLFSTFNPSTVKSANLLKGSIPARYGGRLSSVVDVRVKEGNTEKISGDFGISPLMARATLEGPISKGNSSFLLSARRTIVDPWLKPFSRYQFERNDEEGQVDFFFYDLNAKVNFELGDRDQLFFSGYMGRDRFANQVQGSINLNTGDVVEELNNDELSWGNEIATMRWTHQFGASAFGTGHISLSQYDFDNFEYERVRFNPTSLNESLDYSTRLFSSEISDLIAGYDLDVLLNRTFRARLGFNYTDHQIAPGADFSVTADGLLDSSLVITKDDLIAVSDFESIDGTEFRSYVEGEIDMGPFMLNAGAHYARIGTGEETYTSLQPRLSLRWDVSKDHSFRIGYSEMDQYLHLLRSSGLGLPSDVWLPSTDDLPPEQARQWTASFSSNHQNGWHWSISAYQKEFTSIVGMIPDGSIDINETTAWEGDVPVGEGVSQGIEVQIGKSAGAIKGWATYTYASSDRTFVELNGGESFRASSDRRHTLNLSVLGQLNDNLEFSSSYVYGSSAPVTVPTSLRPVPVNGDIVFLPIYNGINNSDLPTYHRLDIGVNLYNELDWGHQRISFGVYNLYGRRNPFYVDLVQDLDGGPPRLEQVSIIPFLPYVGIGLSF